MNETSQGGGVASASSSTSSSTPNRDPPIGGYPVSSRATPTATSTSHQGQSSGEDSLPSLGTEFESLAGEGLTLSRLLAGDSSTWDPFDPLNPSTTGGPGQYRPWEVDLNMSTAPSTSTTCNSTTVLSTRTSAAPPNVLAPPATRPIHPHPSSFYQPTAHHFIDQRLPSFQSQFQEIPPPPPYHHGHYTPTLMAAAANPVQPFIEGSSQTYHHLQPIRPSVTNASTSYPSLTSVTTTTTTSSVSTGARQRKAPTPGMTNLKTAATPNTTLIDAHPTLTAQLRKKSGRAGSLETTASSEDPDTAGQEAAISSTDSALDKQLSGNNGKINNLLISFHLIYSLIFRSERLQIAQHDNAFPRSRNVAQQWRKTGQEEAEAVRRMRWMSEKG